MWKELIRVDVRYADPFMDRPISVWARIDYQEKDGVVEHNFQFGTLREGDWVPLRYFSAQRLGAMKKAIQIITLLSFHFLVAGAGADPEKAKAEYARICKEADSEEERRRKEVRERLGGLLGFLQLLSSERVGTPDVVGDAEAEEAPPKKIEKVNKKAEAALSSPGLGTLGDRARMRPLKKQHV